MLTCMTVIQSNYAGYIYVIICSAHIEHQESQEQTASKLDLHPGDMTWLWVQYRSWEKFQKKKKKFDLGSQVDPALQ